MNKLALTVVGFGALIAGSAMAADMPLKELPLKAPPPPVWSWTGFYAGVNGGYALGSRTLAFTPNDPTAFLLTCGGLNGGVCPPGASTVVQGGLGGLQLGYNWQFTPNALIGIETDFNWSRIKGTASSSFNWGGLGAGVPGPARFDADQNIKWFGTVRARLGWLPASNFLLYATGGLAYGRVDESVVFTASGNVVVAPAFICSPTALPAPVTCATGATSRTATGWTAGGGFEFAPWHNVSIKTEYLYVNLGGGDTVVLGAPNGFGFAPSTPFVAGYSRTDFHVVRVGVNWHFN
jgi:outer membrane immunogenic protein